MTLHILIERMTSDHLSPVASLEQTAGDVHWSLAQFEKELNSTISRFFVQREGSNILGYGGYWKAGDEAQLTNLVIAPPLRRQSLGKKLLGHLLDQALAEGCRTFTLEVRSRNAAAQALYHQAGFKIQTRRPKAYTQPDDDAMLMEKQL